MRAITPTCFHWAGGPRRVRPRRWAGHAPDWRGRPPLLGSRRKQRQLAGGAPLGSRGSGRFATAGRAVERRDRPRVPRRERDPAGSGAGGPAALSDGGSDGDSGGDRPRGDYRVGCQCRSVPFDGLLWAVLVAGWARRARRRKYGRCRNGAYSRGKRSLIRREEPVPGTIEVVRRLSSRRAASR